MIKQISAVEWLENEFKEAHKMFGGIDTNWIKRFEKAKAMEKEQIKDAWINSLTKGDYNSAEEYYNKTFKSE